MSSDLSRRPHPILKRDSSPFKSPVLPFTSSGPLFSPHVHFPPTPRIAATYPAHSPTTYDRKPILVSPNVVQLPRRGERRLHTPSADRDQPSTDERRGRSRSRDRDRDRDAPTKGSYFHPRAYEACNPEPPSSASASFDLPSMPPLVQDLSPSDESDDIVTPPGAAHAHSSMAIAQAVPLRFPRDDHHQCKEPFTPLPPPPRPSRKGPGRRPDLTRNEQLSARATHSTSFTPSPALDEGCLGGF
ncbi:hypothetical protein C8Q76DRAFT_795618 [Earliella scabrosa]|nr:hypothetical protein C8Q76DRAFT_795618 [Earliella scabrosa]